MEYTVISGTEMNVSRIAQGTWAIGGWMWGGTDERESIRTIHTALDKGINLIDTAPVYGLGVSEEIVGKAIEERGHRDKVFIATKVGLEWHTGSVSRNSSRDRIRKEVQDSLRRLRMDYIDIYQVHWPDSAVPIEETARTMQALFKEGLIRAIGVSNYSPEQMNQFMSASELHTVQPPYNLFERQIDRDVLPYVRAKTLSVLAYGRLCLGYMQIGKRGLAQDQRQPYRLLISAMERSCVRRNCSRKCELKCCASAGVVGDPQAAAMRLNDRPTNGQPHTGPLILGCKECPEDLVRLLRGQSHSGIPDRDQQLTIAGFRLDGKLTSARRFLHSIDAVEHEVHENLLQLHTVCHHLGKVLGKLGADGDRVAARLAVQQNNHFSNELIYIKQLPPQSSLFEQQADAANDVRCAGHVFDVSRGCFACLCHIRLIAPKPPQAGLSVY